MPKVEKTMAQWRRELSREAFKITRKKGTEHAFSHDNFPLADGTFNCVCCDTRLFDQIAKYDSGTGWPSFFQPLEDAHIAESADNGWFSRRTELHCTQCDAHLGHLFSDGPAPTGLRYCINGVALKFAPATGEPD